MAAASRHEKQRACRGVGVINRRERLQSAAGKPIKRPVMDDGDADILEVDVGMGDC